MTTKIEWCDKTINPVTGCTPISEGCEHCFAKAFSKRLAGRAGYPKNNPFKVTLHPDKLRIPNWRKPKRVFIGSMTDLFHKDVKLDWLCKIFEAIGGSFWNQFMILTKRPERMKKMLPKISKRLVDKGAAPIGKVWKHLWLGVTAENQERANERIPILLDTPAAKRFVSIEPMLEKVSLDVLHHAEVTNINCLTGRHGVTYPLKGCCSKLDWVIAGPENGPGKRPYNLDWFRSLRNQCNAATVPFFLKGLELDGVKHQDFPKD